DPDRGPDQARADQECGDAAGPGEANPGGDPSGEEAERRQAPFGRGLRGCGLKRRTLDGHVGLCRGRGSHDRAHAPSPGGAPALTASAASSGCSGVRTVTPMESIAWPPTIRPAFSAASLGATGPRRTTDAAPVTKTSAATPRITVVVPTRSAIGPTTMIGT